MKKMNLQILNSSEIKRINGKNNSQTQKIIESTPILFGHSHPFSLVPSWFDFFEPPMVIFFEDSSDYSINCPRF